MSEILTLNDALHNIHKQPLDKSIKMTHAQFPDGVHRAPAPPDNLFYSDPTVIIGEATILTCAPASVINAVRALGIETNTDVRMLTTRLWAAAQSHKSSPLIKQNPEARNAYFVTQDGIDHLTTLIQHPLGVQEIPLKTFAVPNMGVAHDAFVHGYTGVFVHQGLNHAIAVGGVDQTDRDVTWCVLPPDLLVEQLLHQISSASFRVTQTPVLHSYNVHPNILTHVVNTPIWIFGSPDNAWVPPQIQEEESVTGPDIIIE